jgi:hypothetical protein
MECFLTSSEQYVSYIDCFLMPMNSMSAVLIVFIANEQYVSYTDCFLMPMSSISAVLIGFFTSSEQYVK